MLLRHNDLGYGADTMSWWESEPFVVRCHDCRAEDSARNRIWRESCPDCAESVADTHRAMGHTVTITPPRHRRSA